MQSDYIEHWLTCRCPYCNKIVACKAVLSRPVQTKQVTVDIEASEKLNEAGEKKE